jgi:DNA-binding transcriptional ArsR family regulator
MMQNNIGGDFDNIMELLKPQGVDIQEIKNEIQKLQQEVEELKSENKQLKEEKKVEETPDIFEEYRLELDESVNAIKDIMNKIFDENKNKVDALAVCITKTSDAHGNGMTGVSSACWKAIEELEEEGFAAACEVFTNPRRIAVLKILAKEKLTASEIGQKTGLVGGQLYHHLASLENSGCIEKVDDRYETTSAIQGLLIGLYACLGGMKIAK